MNLAIKLSIITINLNNSEGLRKTLNSVASQIFTNYEHIIIDGGSTDGSVDIIKDYEQKYNGVPGHLYWVSEPDKGIYNAMNKGIKVASGEYCLFLNSGDQLLDHKTLLEICKTAFATEKKILYGDILFQIHDKRKLQRFSMPLDISFFENRSLPHPATLIDRKSLVAYGLFNEQYKIVSDYEFFLRAFLKFPNEFFYINKVIGIFDGSGISSNSKNSEIIAKERQHVQLQLFPQAVWDELKKYNSLKNEFFGLLSSGWVKLAISFIKVTKHIRR